MVMPQAYATGMTITDHLNFSVLSAPLESIDRRTLSQAWYSALFTAQAASPSRLPDNKNSLPTTLRPHQKYADANAMRPCPQKPRAGKESAASVGAMTVVERRRQTTSLAIKIERALRARRANVSTMAFTIKEGNARVQLLMHGTGARLTLVALCPASAKAHVARALAQARYALSLRGVDLYAETREQQC
ncbi:MAG TPA: hypothetical protein VFE17_01720 [Candidatus Baltobacteraceae bacterium]|jgi:hypothetical protein|nr:hypothetical protein [Candidatus Baltobacteraceae bacterium]